jgi:hypothetical protein
MCTREYFEKLKDLKVGKTCIADFSDAEWEEYLRVHREFMMSLTLFFAEEAVHEAEFGGEAEEAAG